MNYKFFLLPPPLQQPIDFMRTFPENPAASHSPCPQIHRVSHSHSLLWPLWTHHVSYSQGLNKQPRSEVSSLAALPCNSTSMTVAADGLPCKPLLTARRVKPVFLWGSNFWLVGRLGSGRIRPPSLLYIRQETKAFPSLTGFGERQA